MSAVWEQCKLKGNQLYSVGQFDDAVREYSRAIQHNSSESTLYSNRGLCHLKRLDCGAAQQDAERALQINSSNAKAHYIIGRCHMTSGALQKSVVAYKQCLEVSMAADPSGSMYHDVFKHYFAARKNFYDDTRAEQMHQVRARVSASQKDLKEGSDACSLLEQLYLMVTMSNSLAPYSSSHGSKMVSSTIGGDFFTTIPDCFVCPISLEVMRDPVIVISAENSQVYSQVSYERSAIGRHFEVNGFFDPVSRKVFGARPPVLVPNLSLRNSIHCFLESHPWLFDESV